MGLSKPLDGTRPLSDALVVSGPFEVAKAPNAYSFERNRLVDIDWSDVFKKINRPLEDTNYRMLQNYVLSKWKGAHDQATLDANVFDLSTWPAFKHDPSSVRNSNKLPADPQALVIFFTTLRQYRINPEAEHALPVSEGCVFRIGTADTTRWYRPVAVDASSKLIYPSKADFANNWDATWALVAGLEQLYCGERPPNFDALTDAEKATLAVAAEKEAKHFFSSSELIRADAAVISRQYDLLKRENELAKNLQGKATALSSEIPGSSLDAIPAIIEQYRELVGFGVELESKKQQLSDAASDLNYHLFTQNTTVTYYENGTGAPVEKPLEEGTLYLKSNRIANWQTFQTVTQTKKGLFSKKTTSYQVAINHSKSFDYYEKAKIDHDPWIEAAEFLAAVGFSVFVFRFSNGQLLSADGSTPTDIIERCEDSEEFRRRCVIALPRLELSLFGDTLIIGYDIIYRPVPDVVPNDFPNLFLKQKLSYRFAWQGVALGELAATIPLSPGEEREVTLSTSYKYESSRTETASSLVDITRIDRSDFETVFEKEVRREKDTTTSASASVSGSYGGVVSGSGSFSTTTTTRDMARQLNRSVQRASQEVNRRSRDERTVTVSEKVETTQQNSVKYQVKNINQGTTLNIAFYHLYNSFQSLLKVDDVRYAAKGGRSVIAGNSLTTEISENSVDLMGIVRWMMLPGNFPFFIEDLSEAQVTALVTELEAVIAKQIAEEYKPSATQAAREGGHNSWRYELIDKSVREIQTLNAAGSIAKIAAWKDEKRVAHRKGVLQHMEGLFAAIKGIEFEDEVTTFSYDSGALYADVYLGDRPGTEPYSENMRRLEEQKIAAENAVVGARARYLNSRAAKQLIGIGGVIDPSKVYVTERDVLYMADGHVQVKLLLIPTIMWNQGWSIVLKSFDGHEGGSFLQSGSVGDSILVFDLPRRFNGDAGHADLGAKAKDHNWFKANVTCENREFGLTIKYKVP